MHAARCAAFASRLDPLVFGGGKRGRSKALFFAELNGTSMTDLEPVIFHATQRTGPTDKLPPRQPRKTPSSLASVSPLVLQLYRCSNGFPHAWRTIFAILKTPLRSVTTPHSLLWPNNSGVLVIEECHVANWPACCRPPL